MNQQTWMGMERIIKNDYNNTTGLVVLKDGITQYEQYFNDTSAITPIHIASVTKSVVSVLFGIALDRGLIKSVDQKVMDFFPDFKIPNGEKTIQRITINNMLTMTAPYKYTQEPYEEFFASNNWMEAALNLLGGPGQIGEFVYSAIVGTHILSGILVRATGQSVMDFARENLFTPLGINLQHNVMFHSKEEQIAWYLEPKTANCWVVDPQGINTAGWGLCVTPTDMVKIGQLFLNGGRWEGKQIVSNTWVDESTREHSRWGEMRYGYLWWIIDDKERTYAALGDGGNVIYINEKKNLVVSIASLFMPEARDRIALIKETIEPMFD